MSFLNRIAHPFLKWRYDLRSKNPYQYKYRTVEITIYPGVFSPRGTITTELFADYLLEKGEWKGKTVLELGAGSGLISFLLEKKGAKAVASDISSFAIEGLKKNQQKLHSSIEIVESDLFERLNRPFDVIILNPPFFAKEPKNTIEKAWYCGENLEYFEHLFFQFAQRKSYQEDLLMILSMNADTQRIIQIAKDCGLRVDEKVILQRKREKHLVIGLANFK